MVVTILSTSISSSEQVGVDGMTGAGVGASVPFPSVEGAGVGASVAFPSIEGAGVGGIAKHSTSKSAAEWGAEWRRWQGAVSSWLPTRNGGDTHEEK